MAGEVTKLRWEICSDVWHAAALVFFFLSVAVLDHQGWLLLAAGSCVCFGLLAGGAHSIQQQQRDHNYERRKPDNRPR